MRIVWVAVIAVLASVTARDARAACGDKITVDGVSIIIPAVVTWDADVAEAIQVAKIKKKPFAIYFVSKENSKIVGESLDAIKAFMKANNNTVPACLADVPVAVEQTREMGVGNYVKVPLRKENRELAEQYGGSENMMVICAPTGEKLAAFACTTEAMKNLDAVRKEIGAWQAKNPQPVASGK
ncbi:MAG: hypothetical protein WCT04_25240 [Planctomycetota bacterium]